MSEAQRDQSNSTDGQRRARNNAAPAGQAEGSHFQLDSPLLDADARRDGRSAARSLKGTYEAVGSGAPITTTADTRARRRPYRVLRFWRWELVSLAAAAGLVAAIVSLSVRFDGQPVPEMLSGMSLNSLVSLLSTLLRATLVLVVAEILGQARWHWFASSSSAPPRPLHNLHDFDRAGRGPLGSLNLIRVLAPRLAAAGGGAGFVALAGALLMIVSFAVGPFTQQAIGTRVCPRRQEHLGASLPVALAIHLPLDHELRDETPLFTGLPLDLQMAMINAITAPHVVDSSISPVCPTGNCTFPERDGVTHSSLGLCSRCIDTSELVSVNRSSSRAGGGGETTFWLPGTANSSALQLSSSSSSYDTLAARVEWGTEVHPLFETLSRDRWSAEFADALPHALANLSIMAFSETATSATCPTCKEGVVLNSTAVRAVAASCALFPCVKHYFARVVLGSLEEHVVRTTPLRRAGNARDPDRFSDTEFYASNNWTALRSPCVLVDDEAGGRTYYTSENISSAPGTTSGGDWRDVLLAGQMGAGQLIRAPAGCLYNMPWPFALNLWDQLRRLLDGHCRWTGGGPDYVTCGGDEVSWWLQALGAREEQRNATSESLGRVVDNVATAVTNYIRRAGQDGASTTAAAVTGEQVEPLAVEGDVWVTAVCTELSWPWLILPGALVVITAVVLALVIVRNHLEHPTLPVWKGSVLPLLLYGLRGGGSPSSSLPGPENVGGGTDEVTRVGQEGRGDDHRPEFGVLDLEGIEDFAKRTTVVLQKEERPGFIIADVKEEHAGLRRSGDRDMEQYSMLEYRIDHQRK